jgi:hypothetical protein
MMEILSLPGIVGAFIGIAIGLINYAAFLRLVVGRLDQMGAGLRGQEALAHQRKVTLARRLVLVIDILFFGTVGYVFGRTMAGYGL